MNSQQRTRPDRQSGSANSYDVVVVGGGAAGLSAALVLARARRRVLVVDSGSPRNAAAAHMHGFLSRDGLPPSDLLDIGREEARGYGADILTATIRRIAVSDGAGFRIDIADRDVVLARRVLIATGLRDVLPAVEGLRDRWARDVLHCPYCHGYEVRHRPIGVLGSGPEAVRYVQLVRQWSDDVVFVVPENALAQAQHDELTARGIGLVEGDARRILVQDDRLWGVELADGRVVRPEVLFVPPRFVPNTDLLVGLGCAMDADGWVVAGPQGQTSVPGVWVAGNVANPRAQVITAAGEGSAAAIAINADLVDEDVRDAARGIAGGSRP